jgi:hypothetical protein
MGIVINQATWGDESAATDITSILQKQAAAGYLDTVANNSLVPAIDLMGTTSTVALSDSEKDDIAKTATTICGSASDNKCIDFQKNQLESNLLQQKVATAQSSANVVTGRRLTLTYTDSATGAQKTVAIPDGQAVKFGTAPTMKMPTLSGSALSALSVVGGIVGTALYVFSIAITYRMLVLSGHLLTAYILTAIAIVVPYSGLVMTPVALVAFKYMDSNKVVPMT